MESYNVYTISSTNLEGTSDFLQSLLQRAKAGEQAAFGQIYDHFFKKIYTFIYFRVGHKEVAEDLTEDVFLKAFGKILSISKDGSLEAWLYQIARNRVIDYYREKKFTVALEEVENTLEYETNVIDIVNLQRQQMIFLKLLKELGAEQQIVLKLKFLENLDNAEIAELLHKNEGAIRVIQHRAIAKLQELIKKYQQDKN
jgi:RNA polymerase sigma-70 factor (ECF subfamily)